MIDIKAGEFRFEETSDSVRVKTALPREQFTIDMLMRHVRHFRLEAGTIIKIQFMSKDYDVLLHSADFIIERASQETKRIIDERGERTANIINYSVIQDSDWRSYAEVEEPAPEENLREPELYVRTDGTVKWNPGKKKFQVLEGDKVVAEVDDKETANAIASGAEKIPVAA